MSLNVFNKGEFGKGSPNYNTNCPTNPVMTTTVTNRLYSMIVGDDSVTTELSKVIDDLETEYSNLVSTPGYRIKCYDNVSQQGIQLNTINLTTKHHYVLIHSDDHLQHHFAKITEIITEDVAGDTFEFEPKLGNEIPKGTKFMLFEQDYPTPSQTQPAAITAGIKDDLKSELHVARPLFYFPEGVTKKPNELDHNTKYFAKIGDKNNTTVATLADAQTTFLVEQDFSYKIVDYSKYTLNVKLVDILNRTDRGQSIDGIVYSKVSQEGLTLPTEDFTDYEDVFHNARRQVDDDISGSFDFSGPIRYLHYDFSPTECNTVRSVVESSFTRSISDKAGLAEAKIMDNFRILPKKISENEPYRFRHFVHSGDLDKFVSSGITIDSHSSGQIFNVLCDFDPTNILATNDLVKIGNYIHPIHSVTSSTIRVSTYRRLESESEFVIFSGDISSYSGDVLVRAFNHRTNKLTTTFPFLEGRNENLYVKFTSGNNKKHEATVTASNAIEGTLTLSMAGDSYYSDILDYAYGGYQLFIERFSGEVENVDTYKEEMQTFVEISGRDDFRRLLNPIINKNYNFSEDYILTSQSFYPEIEDTGFTISTVNGESLYATSRTFNHSTGNMNLVAGDVLFIKWPTGAINYIGKVSSYSDSDDEITLADFPRTSVNGEASVSIFKRSNKDYVFGKALSSNAYDTNTVTSLLGLSDKGVIFQSGVELTSTGADGTSLVGTSADTEANANGYEIHETSRMLTDKNFQTKLKGLTAGEETFDVVNTLLDFTVLNVSEDNNFTLIELAPYVPLTLGRVDNNPANVNDCTFTSFATATASSFSNRVITITPDSSVSLPSLGEAIYQIQSDGTYKFLGNFLEYKKNQDDETIIYLDRKVTNSNLALYTLAFKSSTYDERDKLNHNLNLINGSHLHGGKTIGLISPLTMEQQSTPTGDSHLMLFDSVYDFDTTTDDTYMKKHGSPYYRIMNMEKGNFDVLSPKRTSLLDDYGSKYYYEKGSRINYYADAYRFDPGYYYSGSEFINGITGVGKTAAGDENHLLYESLGFNPAGGPYSRFFFINYGMTNDLFTLGNALGFTSTFSTYTKFAIMDAFDQPDPKAARLFLFANTDLEPYSGTRKDSLLNSSVTRNLLNYDITLIKEPVKLNSRTENGANSSQTDRISNLDKDYVRVPIVENQTLSSKQFSIMRLTECVYDWHFNQFNPEYSSNRAIPEITYPNITATNPSINIVSWSGSVATCNVSAASAFPATTKVIGDGGQFIGTVSSVSGTDITFADDNYKTNPASGGTRYTGAIRSIAEATCKITGRGLENQFECLTQNTMTRGAFTSAGYGGTGSAFDGKSVSSRDLTANYDSTHVSTIYFPLDLGSVTSQKDTGSSQIIDQYRNLVSNDTASGTLTTDIESRTMFKQALMVALDFYSIEDGSDVLTKGEVVPIEYLRRTQGTAGSDFNLLNATSENFEYKKFSDDVGTDNTGNNFADGAVMGMKFRLRVGSNGTKITKTHGSSRDAGIGNRDLYKTTISITSSNKWLEFVGNLSGCYLVSEAGLRRERPEGTTVINYSNSVVSGESILQYTCEGITPNVIAQILSHEVDTSASSSKHVIVTDVQLIADHYRIMQPNETCFFSFSPNSFNINELSGRYTKMMGEDATYSLPDSFTASGLNTGLRQKRDGSSTKSVGGSEGILSMYVVADVENKSANEDHLIYRNGNNVSDLIDGEFTVCYSDGESFIKTNLKATESLFGQSGGTSKQITNVTLNDMQQMSGIVSFSEPFTIKTSQISGDFKRAVIGSTVTVGLDSEKIVNDLLESNDIVYTHDSQTFSHIISPNFSGLPLLNAINYANTKKDYSLTKIGDNFVNKKMTSSDYSPKFRIDDSGNFDLYSFDRKKSSFDKYNEIVVYGRNHKATRMDLRDIKKNGKKTLEIIELELDSKADVEARAMDLFMVHNQANEGYVVEIGHKGISQIRPGDIVTFEIVSENIPLNSYMVTDITFNLYGNLILELNRYTKSLEDRFAEIQLESRRNASQIREGTFDESNTDFLLGEGLKIEPRRLLIRKITAGGTIFGFSTTFGFSTAFGISGTTSTDLEDVIY